MRAETEKFLRKLVVPAVVSAGIAVLAFLYFFNPQEIPSFPRCPFLALTGLKCPGCGTLRGIHSLLHLRFADAWAYNPLMVVSIPFLAAFLAFPRLCTNVTVGRTVLLVVLAWWLLRNIFSL